MRKFTQAERNLANAQRREKVKAASRERLAVLAEQKAAKDKAIVDFAAFYDKQATINPEEDFQWLLDNKDGVVAIAKLAVSVMDGTRDLEAHAHS